MRGMSDAPLVRRHTGDFHWEGVDVLAYKQEGSAPFRDVTRQVLFDTEDPPAQLRYSRWPRAGTPRSSATSTCTR
jgi:hypothetical protein